MTADTQDDRTSPGGAATTRRSLVDVHSHFITEHYVDVAKGAGYVQPDGMPESYWPTWDPDEHIAMMDRLGITRSVISLSSPGVQLTGIHVAALAAETNDVAAAAARAHPERFGFFASLPAMDETAARTETARAFDELHATGAILMSNTAGAYLGDPRLDPVLAELNRRKAVLLLHPTTPVGFGPISIGQPAPMLEFLFDTTRTVVDFAMSGAAERYPDIRLVIPHMASVIPEFVPRVAAFQQLAGIGGGSIQALMDRAWWDLAGSPGDAQMLGLRTVARDDHLLYGSDYCWTRENGAQQFLNNLDGYLPVDWRTSVSENANRLLG